MTMGCIAGGWWTQSVFSQLPGPESLPLLSQGGLREMPPLCFHFLICQLAFTGIGWGEDRVDSCKVLGSVPHVLEVAEFGMAVPRRQEARWCRVSE